MKKTLTLKTDRLTELTHDELQQAVGGTYTGATGCILSSQKPCVTFMCTANLSCINGQ